MEGFLQDTVTQDRPPLVVTDLREWGVIPNLLTWVRQ